MKLRPRGANSLRKCSFDVHVHVFERLPFEFSQFDLLLDGAQSIVDLLLLVGGYDACWGRAAA
ncbi:MAG TPA: hypothetical protein VGI41_09055 [Candidatus Udaeobacter sp.]